MTTSGLPESVFDTVNGSKWRRVGVDRKAGVLVALSSLRSEHSTGTGEFLDIEKLVDWCKQTNQKIIQLLPINDTAYDAPPYCAVTAFGMNPMYLSLQDIPGVDPAEIAKLKAEYDGMARIIYWKLKGEKMRLLWGGYVSVKDSLKTDAAFRAFCEDNKYWLDIYCAFMVMKDKHAQQSWRTWDDITANYGSEPPSPRPPLAGEGDPELAEGSGEGGRGVTTADDAIIRRIVERHADEIGFYRFLQFQCDRQLRRVRKYANERGVFIKGDIPFLLNNDAADVWALPRFFRLDLTAGCPPDFYNERGQYWSFPTYRWDVMEREDFRWWKERLRHAEKYFDIFRIDHVLGFFRLWSIPEDGPREPGTNFPSAVFGRFVPSLHVTQKMLRDAGLSEKDEGFLVSQKILLPVEEPNHGDHGDHGDGSSQGVSQITPPPTTSVSSVCSVVNPEYVFKWEFQKEEPFLSFSADFKERILRLEDYFAENDEVQNGLWLDHGKKFLSMFSKNTDMLICAEDLGTVPACVRPCLDELGITKLIVDRWSKFIPNRTQKKQGMQEYWVEPQNFDALSVCTPSNHDMNTVRGWWLELAGTDAGRRERAENAQRFGWPGNTPDMLSADAVRMLVYRNLIARSVFSILYHQDILDTNPAWQNPDAFDDRFNVPGTLADRNWSLRMRVPLEDLCRATDFNQMYAQMVAMSGR